MAQKVLVIGGTGMLGVPVVKSLKEANIPVRVFTRNKATALNLFDSSVEVMEGDINHRDDLLKAMDGCEGVHINLSGEQEYENTKKIVEAARKSGVKRISIITGLTVCQQNAGVPFIGRKYEAEKAVMQSGLTYYIFRPTWFFESIPKFVLNGRASYFGKQKTPLKFVAAKDYAQMVTNAYLEAQLPSGIFSVEGPEAHTFQEVLETYVSLKHPEIKKVRSTPYFIGRVLAFLSKNPQLKELVSFMQFFEKVATNNYHKEAPKIVGKPSTTFSEWMKEQ